MPYQGAKGEDYYHPGNKFQYQQKTLHGFGFWSIQSYLQGNKCFINIAITI